jgi:hypothetical protein
MSKRRSPGEGWAYQIADGSWRGFVDLGSHEGRRRRKYVRGRTKAVSARFVGWSRRRKKVGCVRIVRRLWRCGLSGISQKSPR